MKILWCLVFTMTFGLLECNDGKERKTKAITFLVTVNDTWMYNPPLSNNTCFKTVKTMPLAPDTPKNESEIQVGDCDHGPLVYSVSEQEHSQSSVHLTFYSSVIADASPPTCVINWNYQYKPPTQFIGIVTNIEAVENLLPSCAMEDSREGYHLTDYWFYLFDWSLNSMDSSKFTPIFPSKPLPVSSITFLIALNMTGNLCSATNKTVPMKPGVSAHENEHVIVDGCENATMNFSIVTRNTVDGFHTYVPVTFFSTAFPIGYPVNCTILWDYSYRMPTAKNPDRSPLPGCYTTYLGGAPYTVYYWIYILDWEYDY